MLKRGSIICAADVFSKRFGATWSISTSLFGAHLIFKGKNSSKGDLLKQKKQPASSSPNHFKQAQLKYARPTHGANRLRCASKQAIKVDGGKLNPTN